METEPDLCVIVALYNARDTVKAAVSSALEQQGGVDIEVVVVDDGSSDGSVDVVRELAADHPLGERIRVIEQASNTGAAAARNRGVAEARGRFVSFLDSDDEYLPTFAATLLLAARSTGSQIAVGNVVHIRPDGHETVRHPAWSGVRSGIEVARLGLLDKVSPFTCDKVIDRALFSEVRFPEGLVNEDFLANPVLASRAQSVVVIDEPVYRYRIHATSVTWTATTRSAELNRSVAYLRENLLEAGADRGRMDRAIAAADAFLTLMTGQRALLHDANDPVVAECRRRLRRLGLRSVAPLGLVGSVGASVFVCAPRLYRRLYRRRVARLYGSL